MYNHLLVAQKKEKMNILYFTYPFGALLIFAYAIGLGVYFTRRFKLGWKLYFIGAATFILSQVFHIPFNILVGRWMANGTIPTPPDAYKLIFQAVFLGLSAGIFEEFARYAMYRWWAHDARSWGQGLLAGAGHGGVEALLVGGSILLTYIYMVSYKTADLTTVAPPEQLEALRQGVANFWSAAWYNSLLGAFERLLTLPVHIGLSVMVLQAFTRRQARWLWLAVLWHAVLDAGAVITVSMWGMYAAEAWVALCGVSSVIIALALRTPEPVEIEDSSPAPAPITADDLVPIAVADTTEKLDNSRFAR